MKCDEVCTFLFDIWDTLYMEKMILFFFNDSDYVAFFFKYYIARRQTGLWAVTMLQKSCAMREYIVCKVVVISYG